MDKINLLKLRFLKNYVLYDYNNDIKIFLKNFYFFK